jgi:hypothetical protein
MAPAQLGRPFRWLLASSIVTNVGDGIAFAAVPVLGSASRWAPAKLV